MVYTDAHQFLYTSKVQCPLSTVQCWAKRPFFNDLFIGKEKAGTIDHQKRENLLNVWRFSAIIGPLSAASIVGPNVRVCVTDHQILYKVIAVAVQTVHDVEKKLVSYFIGLVLFFFFMIGQRHAIDSWNTNRQMAYLFLQVNSKMSEKSACERHRRCRRFRFTLRLLKKKKLNGFSFVFSHSWTHKRSSARFVIAWRQYEFFSF